jgi:hypothetical protein
MNPGSLPGALEGRALQARDLLRSLCAPAPAPFLADWPDPARSHTIWRERPPGTDIHHANEEPHAMRTGARPLLALYVWRSEHLNQRARLEPVYGT